MVRFLFTFDYELPLGGANSYNKGLFEPSAKIIDLGHELNVPFVFYADIFSAIKFKEWEPKGYYLQFVNQLRRAVELNHDVQLHLHPHWITSEFKNDIFIPSQDSSLSNFVPPKSSYSIDRIVKEGVDFLTEICSAVDKDYRCIAYRAGGYRISDATEEIITALINNGILIDSSFISGFYQKTASFTTDFKKVESNTWYISAKDGLYSEIKDGLFEIPVTSMPVNAYYILLRRIKKIIHKNKLAQRTYHNTGKGFPQKKTTTSFSENVRHLFNPVRLSFDANHTTLKQLNKIVSYNIKKHKNLSPIYITTISHPKSMGEYHINLLRDFICSMKEKYEGQVEFTTYQKLTS